MKKGSSGKSGGGIKKGMADMPKGKGPMKKKKGPMMDEHMMPGMPKKGCK